jgi:hypothetical protein
MKDEYSWIEKLFKKFPVPYPIVSLIIGGMVYLIFKFFITKVVSFPWDFFTRLAVSTLSIQIAFQLAGIQYLLNNMKSTFRQLKWFNKSGENIDDFYVRLENRFYRSHLFYAIVASVIVPKIILELIRILGGGPTYYIADKTAMNLLLDIYNYFIVYLMLFLLAFILWIIYNIAWALNEIGSDRYKYLIKLDIYIVDKIGGLKAVRSLVLKVLTIYFISITLAIIYYISPISIISYTSFFFILLLIIGICFFLMELRTIRKLLRDRIEDEINKINEGYQREHQKLMDIVTGGNYNDKLEELSWVKSTMETLHNERERMVQLYDNSKGYDLTTIVQFIGSIIPPLIAFIEKLFNFGLEIKKFL